MYFSLRFCCVVWSYRQVQMDGFCFLQQMRLQFEQHWQMQGLSIKPRMVAEFCVVRMIQTSQMTVVCFAMGVIVLTT